MKNWITERREAEMASAMESAVRNYNKIEKEAIILETVEEAIGEFDGSLEAIIKGNWSIYTNTGELQIYTWRTDEETKEECASLLMGLVEAYGNAKRSKAGTDIQYRWENVVGKMDMVLQMPPATTGCKLIEKTVAVPAQPATTRIEYEIACSETVKVE